MEYSDIYFAILSVATLGIAGLLLLCLIHIVSILYNIKRISSVARKEAEFITKSFAKGASILGSEISEEASGFLRTIFTLLLSQFGGVKKSRPKKRVRDI